MVKVTPPSRLKKQNFLRNSLIRDRYTSNKRCGIRNCRVKICGITNLEDALYAVKLGADALGFVFWKNSPRYIIPAVAKNIIKRLPSFVNTVGVFVDEKEITIKKIASLCGLDILQFHGRESPNYCKKFKGYKTIKAFRIKDKVDIKNISKYKVDAYLLDSYQKGLPGGTGKIFNWKLIKKIKTVKKPIILSGGLKSSNVKKAIKLVSPYAVDVSSSLESYPGQKDYKLMKAFFRVLNESVE